MEFEVIAPTAEQKPTRGGKQTKLAVKLRVFSFPEMQLTSEHTFDSAYEAAKFAELYNSRSNLAAKIKRDGNYLLKTVSKLLLFERLAE